MICGLLPTQGEAYSVADARRRRCSAPVAFSRPIHFLFRPVFIRGPLAIFVNDRSRPSRPRRFVNYARTRALRNIFEQFYWRTDLIVARVDMILDFARYIFTYIYMNFLKILKLNCVSFNLYIFLKSKV